MEQGDFVGCLVAGGLSGLPVLFVWRFELRHDLKDPVAAFLGLVELKVELGRIFDVQGLIDLRLPLLLERI